MASISSLCGADRDAGYRHWSSARLEGRGRPTRRCSEGTPLTSGSLAGRTEAFPAGPTATRPRLLYLGSREKTPAQASELEPSSFRCLSTLRRGGSSKRETNCACNGGFPDLRTRGGGMDHTRKLVDTGGRTGGSGAMAEYRRRGRQWEAMRSSAPGSNVTDLGTGRRSALGCGGGVPRRGGQLSSRARRLLIAPSTRSSPPPVP